MQLLILNVCNLFLLLLEDDGTNAQIDCKPHDAQHLFTAKSKFHYAAHVTNGRLVKPCHELFGFEEG